VVLYFDNMSKKQTCWKVEVKQDIKIEDLKPAIVKIYDYYNQEDMFSTQYTLPAGSK
jgi:alpha-2-macroglobulin